MGLIIVSLSFVCVAASVRNGCAASFPWYHRLVRSGMVCRSREKARRKTEGGEASVEEDEARRSRAEDGCCVESVGRRGHAGEKAALQRLRLRPRRAWRCEIQSRQAKARLEKRHPDRKDPAGPRSLPFHRNPGVLFLAFASYSAILQKLHFYPRLRCHAPPWHRSFGRIRKTSATAV